MSTTIGGGATASVRRGSKRGKTGIRRPK